MKKIFVLSALVACFSIVALADIPRPSTPIPTPSPKAKKALDSRLYITIRADEKEARLLIPKEQIKELRAQLDELDGGSNNAAFLTFSRTQTVLSGTFLSLAMVFGGVWLARSRGKNFKPSKTMIAGAILLAFGAGAALVYANVGPPPEARSITGRIFTPAVHQYKQASGKIKIEASDESAGVQLIVPDVPSDKKSDEE